MKIKAFDKIDIVEILKQQGALYAFLIIIIVASVRYPEFMSYTNITNVLRQSSMIGLISIGMTFVILTGGIDLSVGAIAALASVIAALLSTTNTPTMIFVPILLSGCLGFINGIAITKLRIAPFIATLAMMTAARGIALVLTKGISVRVDEATLPTFKILAQSYFIGIPLPVWIFIVALLIAIYISRYTSFGRHVYAIGGNEEASIMMGLRVNRIKIIIYTSSGLLAGLAGVILASRLSAGQPVSCDGWEMTAIAAVALGGTQLTGGKGRVSGTFVGVLITGVISNMINLQGNVNSWWQGIITGLLLLTVVIIQSQIQKGTLLVRPNLKIWR